MDIFLIIMMFLIIILVFGILGIYLAGLWKLFKKAGKNGWEAIIPFYNTWVLTEISGLAWWYALIIILSSLGIFGETVLSGVLSLASLAANFFIFYNLSKKFHKDIGIAILATIFPVVMVPIMAFSGSFQYDKDVVVSENGPINANSNSSSTTNTDSNANFEEKQFCPYCGKQIIKDSKFCGNCGNEIRNS